MHFLIVSKRLKNVKKESEECKLKKQTTDGYTNFLKKFYKGLRSSTLLLEFP